MGSKDVIRVYQYIDDNLPYTGLETCWGSWQQIGADIVDQDYNPSLGSNSIVLDSTGNTIAIKLSNRVEIFNYHNGAW